MKYNDLPDVDEPRKARGSFISPEDVAEEAERQGVDPVLGVSVIKQESGGRPNAKSKAGAEGLAQLMPDTGKYMARKKGERYNPNDPAQNVRLGIAYLKEQLDTFGGDYPKALAAYNAGPGRVKKAGGVPKIKETQDYVKRIRSGYERIANSLPDLGGDDEPPVKPKAAPKATTNATEYENELPPVMASVKKVSLPELPGTTSQNRKTVKSANNQTSKPVYQPRDTQEAAVLTRAKLINAVGDLRRKAPSYSKALDGVQREIETAFSDVQKAPGTADLPGVVDALSKKLNGVVKTINTDAARRRAVVRRRQQEARARQQQQTQPGQPPSAPPSATGNNPLLDKMNRLGANPMADAANQRLQEEVARKQRVADSMAKPMMVTLRTAAEKPTAGPIRTNENPLLDKLNNLTTTPMGEAAQRGIEEQPAPQSLTELVQGPVREFRDRPLTAKLARGVYSYATGKSLPGDAKPNPRRERAIEAAKDYDQALQELQVTPQEAIANPQIKAKVYQRTQELQASREFEQTLDINQAVRRKAEAVADFQSNPVTRIAKILLPDAVAEFVSDKTIRAHKSIASGVLDIPEGIAILAGSTVPRAKGQMSETQRRFINDSAERIRQNVARGMGLESARAAIDRTFVNDPRRTEGLEGAIGEVVEGLASTVPFAAAALLTKGAALGLGATTRTAIVAGRAAVGLTGILSGAAQGYQDAKRSGASDDAAMASAKLMGAFGVLEVIGLPQSVLKMGLTRPLMHRAMEFAEEFGQESVNAWMQNLTASVLIGYDPDRGLDEGVAKAGIIALIAASGPHAVDATRHVYGVVSQKIAALRQNVTPEVELEITKQAASHPEVQRAAQVVSEAQGRIEQITATIAEDQQRLKRGEMPIATNAEAQLAEATAQAQAAAAAMDEAVTAAIEPATKDISQLSPVAKLAALTIEQANTGKTLAPIPENATVDQVKEIYRQRVQDFGADSVAAAEAWAKVRELSPEVQAQAGKDRFYSMPEAEALLDRLGNEIATEKGVKAIDAFLKKNKIVGITAEDIAGDYLTKEQGEADDLNAEYEKMGLPTSGVVQADGVQRVEAGNPVTPDTGGRVIDLEADLEAEKQRLKEMAEGKARADAQEAAMLAELEQQAAAKAKAKAEADKAEQIRIAELEKVENEQKKQQAKQQEIEQAAAQKKALEDESTALVQDHRQRYTASLEANDYAGAIRSLRQIEGQMKYQLQQKAETPAEVARKVEREADLDDVKRELQRLQKLADTEIQNGNQQPKPSGPLFSDMANDPEYQAQQKKMNGKEADRKWMNLAEESRNRKLTDEEKVALKSPIEYIKHATMREGIRVGTSGERALLGAKESGIVGLTNQSSKFTTADAQVMLDEGGFTLPDGHRFIDESVTENDVIDYLINYGKAGTSEIADLDSQLADEEAAYWEKKQAAEEAGYDILPSEEQADERPNIDTELAEFDGASRSGAITESRDETDRDIPARPGTVIGRQDDRGTTPAQRNDAGVAASSSPFVRLRDANSERIERIRAVGLASEEGTRLMREVYDFARRNGIEKRHAEAIETDLMNEEFARAAQADKDARQILGETQYQVYNERFDNADEEFNQLTDRIARGFETPQVKRRFFDAAQRAGFSFAEAQEIIRRAREIAQRAKTSAARAKKTMDARRARGRRAGWQTENQRLTDTYGGTFLDDDGHEVNVRIFSRTGRNQVVVEFLDLAGDVFDRFVTSEHYLEAGLLGRMGLDSIGRARIGVSGFERMSDSQLRLAVADLNQLLYHGYEQLRAAQAAGDINLVGDLEEKIRDYRLYLDEGQFQWEKRGLQPPIQEPPARYRNPQWMAMLPEQRRAENQRLAKEWASKVDAAAHEAATSPLNDRPLPTDAQISAGNYKKGHVYLHGLDISIENPKGSTRSGTDADGTPWSVKMTSPYGYIKRSSGADGEQIDVYIGNEALSERVFIIDQVDAESKKFDEHKVILNTPDRTVAEALYDAHFSDGRGPERRAAVTEMTLPEFKDWLKKGDNTKPISDLPANEETQSTQQVELQAYMDKRKSNAPTIDTDAPGAKKEAEVVMGRKMKDAYLEVDRQRYDYEQGQKARKQGIMQSGGRQLTTAQQLFYDAVENYIYKGNRAFELMEQDFTMWIGRGKSRKAVATADDFRKANPKYKELSKKEVQDLLQPYFGRASKTIDELWENPPQQVVDAYGAKVFTLQPNDNNVVLFSLDKGKASLGFFSAIGRVIDSKMPFKASAQQVLGILKNPQSGIKPDEIKWTGIDDWLKRQTGSVTKEQVLEFLRENNVQVKEIIKNGNEAKFSSYTLPGGEESSYRELLLTLPSRQTRSVEDIDAEVDALLAREDWGSSETRARHQALFDERNKAKGFTGGEVYRSSHWDEPNVIAHVRYDIRTDADGKRVMHVAEIQSDWMQDKRRGKEVPDAPFAKTWHELALKRILRLAAENNLDRVTWDTGETNADRFDLSKKVEQIEYFKKPDGYTIYVTAIDGTDVDLPKSEGLSDGELADIVGKEMAEKIINGEGERKTKADGGFLQGDDLKVGGEGMKGFYDQILPAFAAKYGRKWGAKVGEGKVQIQQAENQDFDETRLRLEENNGWRVAEYSPQGAFNGYIDGPYREKSQAETARQKQIDTFYKKPARFSRVHSFDITDAMKESVLTDGQPLFSLDPAWGAPPIAAYRTVNDAIRDARIELRADDRSRTLYMNEQARMVIAQALYRITKDENALHLSGVNLGWTKAQQLSRLIRGQKSLTGDDSAAAAKLDQLAEKIETEAARKQTVSLATYSGERTLSQAKATAREENFHAWQTRVGGNTAHLVKADWFKSQPQAAAIQEALGSLGYRNHEMATEAAAHIAAGDYESVGLKKEDALEFLHAYFNEVAARHGEAGFETLKRVHPDVKALVEHYDQVSARNRQSDAGKPQADLSGESTQARIGAPPDSLSTSRNRVPSGTEEGRKESGRGDAGPASQQGNSLKEIAENSINQVRRSARDEQGYLRADLFVPHFAVDGLRYIVGGGRRFAEWAAPHLKEFGQRVRPVLRKAWEAAKEFWKDERGILNLQKLQQLFTSTPAPVSVSPHFDPVQWSDDVLKYVLSSKLSQQSRNAIIQAYADGMAAVVANDGAALWKARREVQRLATSTANTRTQKAARIGLGIMKLAWNLTRGLMAGGELSIIGRQGGWNDLLHPVKSGQALWEAKDAAGVIESVNDYVRAVGLVLRGKVKGSGSVWEQMAKAGDNAYNRALALLENHPRYAEARKAKVRLATSEEGKLHPDMLAGEENFSVGALNALPILRQLERINKIFLDLQRLHAFDAGAQAVEAAGGTPEEIAAGFATVAKEINRTTGQANVQEHLQGAVSLGAIGMFSPRWFISRFQVLNPYQYLRPAFPGASAADKAIALDRWKAVAMIGAYAGVVGGIVVGLGGSVGYSDPDDKDFLKARLGETRFSLLPAGLGTYVTFLLRMGKHGWKYARGGDPAEKDKAEDQFMKFMRYKESPNLSLFHDQVLDRYRDEGQWETTGHNALGESRTLSQSVRERLFPIYWKNLLEVAKRDAAGKVALGMEVIGLDANTYDSKESVGRKANDQSDPKNLSFVEKTTTRKGVYERVSQLEAYKQLPETYRSELMERVMDDELADESRRKEGKSGRSNIFKRMALQSDAKVVEGLKKLHELPDVKAMDFNQKKAADAAYYKSLQHLRGTRASERAEESLPELPELRDVRQAMQSAIKAARDVK